ncbi:MAG: dephospho-CoA kinase [Spirochaetota bacterium]|nr:dephospho-CoA kinase [Thermodesulfobacteriota bacterium]MDY6968582.1 dephospho-CoA kinase [Spirochaetota bacterium]
MTILGLSGSIASGKSTVSKMFVELGAYLIDWDKLGHDVMLPNQSAWKAVVEYFGKEILNEDQTINRPVLGQKVFNKPEELQKLNQLVHPEIYKEDERLANKIRSEYPNAVIVKDIPLLNPDMKKVFDMILVVFANEKNQIKRLAERGFDQVEAIKRIKAQPPIEEKMEIADFIIYNDGSLDETKRQVEKIYTTLTSEKE